MELQETMIVVLNPPQGMDTASSPAEHSEQEALTLTEDSEAEAEETEVVVTEATEAEAVTQEEAELMKLQKKV